MILVLRRLFLAATPLALAVVLWFHRFLLVLLLGRRRWVKRQPGAFAGAIRVSSGDVEGLGPKWKRGYGRWVGDVLVWTKAPLFFRNEFVPIDRIAGERSAHRNEVKRLGDEPVVIEFESDTAKLQVAARAEHRTLVSGATTPPDARARSLGR